MMAFFSENQIELDLTRTFPNHKLFSHGETGIADLRRILIAYSNHNQVVGYCQGMRVFSQLNVSRIIVW
jgi:hypothetical protein